MKILGRFAMVAVLLAGVAALPNSADAQRWDNKKGAIDPSNTHVRASRIAKQAPMRTLNLPNASPGERARVALNGFALCRISDDRPEFEALVSANPVPKLSDKAYWKFIRDNSAQNCLFDSDLTLTAELMSGAGFLAMLRLTYLRAENVPTLHAIDYASLTDPNHPEGQHYIGTRSFAQCVVLAAPQQVAEMLFSRELGKSEADALVQVTPHLGPCLSQGREMTITRPLLFGWLAEAMYRASKVQPSA